MLCSLRELTTHRAHQGGVSERVTRCRVMSGPREHCEGYSMGDVAIWTGLSFADQGKAFQEVGIAGSKAAMLGSLVNLGGRSQGGSRQQSLGREASR